jgi:hypothetical protein
MKVFISYASEYRKVADRIAVGLRQESVDVFFDRDQLPPGGAYDTGIRKAIKQSDLFIFLISPESVSENAYALTEVGFARERWKNPTNRLLPVFVAKTSMDEVPAYLRSVTILEPEGDLIAEVLANVARLSARRQRRSILLTGGLFFAAVIFVLMLAKFTVWQNDAPAEQTCYLILQVRTTRTLPANAGEFVAYLSTSDGATNSFLLSNAGAGTAQVNLGLGQDEYWEAEIVDTNGVSFRKIKILGCPQTPMERELDGKHYLLIQPK